MWSTWRRYLAKPCDFLTVTEKPPQYYEHEAKRMAVYWRLVFEGGVPPSDVDRMDWDEVMEANAALDLFGKGVACPWLVKR